MSTQKSTVPATKLVLYDKLIATAQGVERKGAAMPYTSLNGHMFSFLGKDGSLNLRLPEEEREAFLKRHRAALSVQHGVVMQEYVAVPDALFNDAKALKKYFQASADYVRTLKPKATKRKK